MEKEKAEKLKSRQKNEEFELDEAKSCNMTNEGTLCEVHGMKICPETNVNELSTATLKSYKEKQLDTKDKSAKQSYNRLVGNARATRRIDAKKNNEDVDYEGEMAKTQLKALSAKASALASMMSDNQQLEAWVQSKLTNAKHDIDAVHDYLTYGEPTKEDAPNDALMTFPGMNVDTAFGRV
jgi:monoamine oxidase